MLLQDKTLVVTGGSSGIGAAIARRAAAEGARVVIDHLGATEAATALVTEISNAGGQAIAVEADVSRVADLERLIATAVETYGRLDVMVNNAGIEAGKSLLDTPEELYDAVMAVNLKGAFFGTQLAARQFIAQRDTDASDAAPQGPGGAGVVINISSVHEDWPMPGNSVYCLAKGGMRMMTRNTGVELGQHGIRVLNVAPGAIKTPMNAETMANPDDMAALRAAIPVGRLGEADEIADTVVFLASDRSRYATATTVFVDGGLMQSSVGL